MRENLRLIAAGLSLLVVVGCGENATAPQATTTRSLSASAPAFDYGRSGFGFGDQVSSFTVTSAGGTYNVGGLFDINFPANSICAEDGSYAAGNWDAACAVRKSSVKITATVRITSAGLSVDFSPELRFVPSKTVTVSTDLFSSFIRSNRFYFSRNPEALRVFALYYMPTMGADAVADYISDPSLVTHIDLSTGLVWRRVKHFSGYSATTGRMCDPGPGDPDCIDVSQQ